MRKKSEHNKLKSDYTLPPEHPLPPDELGRYGPERDHYAEKDIADYVLLERPDEKVLHLEHIKTEYVLGCPYDIWDVSTDKNRWWVLTNPTNLYSQRDFPTLDFTLSFHIGFTIHVCSRLEQKGEPEPTPFDEVGKGKHPSCWNRPSRLSIFKLSGCASVSV